MNILGRDHTVLQYIALHGPSAGYTISQKTNLTQRRVYAALQNLQKKKIITLTHIEKNRPGQDKKLFGFTLDGLVLALSTISSDNWDEIASHFSTLLPLILGKWRFFSENEVKEEAALRLKKSIKQFSQGFSEFEAYIPGSYWVDATIRLTTLFYLFDIWNMYFNFEAEPWMRVCAKDPEIKEFLILTYWFVKDKLISLVDETETLTQILYSVSTSNDESELQQMRLTEEMYNKRIPKLVHKL